MIREFFQKIGHTIPNINNQNLGIKNHNNESKKIYLPEKISEKMTNNLPRTLLDLQIYFGLTLSEAMRLSPTIHIQKNTLWITRDIATNSHDRMIPIRNNEQIKTKKLFQDLCKEQNLILTFGYHSVRYAL